MVVLVVVRQVYLVGPNLGKRGKIQSKEFGEATRIGSDRSTEGEGSQRQAVRTDERG